MTELECALEENEKLRILDAEKTALIVAQAAQIVAQAERITHLELLLEKITFQLAAMARMQYGQKSEASNLFWRCTIAMSCTLRKCRMDPRLKHSGMTTKTFGDDD